MGYLNVSSRLMSPCPIRAHHTYINFLFTLGSSSIKLVHEVVNHNTFYFTQELSFKSIRTIDGVV